MKYPVFLIFLVASLSCRNDVVDSKLINALNSLDFDPTEIIQRPLQYQAKRNDLEKSLIFGKVKSLIEVSYFPNNENGKISLSDDNCVGYRENIDFSNTGYITDQLRVNKEGQTISKTLVVILDDGRKRIQSFKGTIVSQPTIEQYKKRAPCLSRAMFYDSLYLESEKFIDYEKEATLKNTFDRDGAIKAITNTTINQESKPIKSRTSFTKLNAELEKEYIYDEQGHLLKIDCKSELGEMNLEEHFYDKNDSGVKQIVKSVKGRPGYRQKAVTNYHYKNEMLTKIVRRDMGITSRDEFDVFGRASSHHSSSKSDEMIKIKYEHDEYSNWTSKIFYNGNGNSTMALKRTYTYYE